MDAGEQPPSYAQPPPPESVAVERAICQLLVGRVDDAADMLGLGPNPTGIVADPQVERFVADHSPTGDITVGAAQIEFSSNSD
jgi:hypothetical protein